MSAAALAKARTAFDERSIVRTVLTAQGTALRERGRFVVPDDLSDVRLRPAAMTDAGLLARLHAEGIDTGFLPTLGLRFLRHLYASLIAAPNSVVIVAEDGLGPVGFVAGVPDVDAFYRRFLRSRGWRAGLAAVPALARPGTWRRALETLRYDGSHHDADAELLSMAVAEPYRGRGIGRRLGDEFLAVLGASGVDRVKVVVGEGNAAAQSAYRAMGFEDAGRIEVHRGETSVVMLVALAS
jgi:ribosomal protein S18 acetylase RimI-like enzyme